MSCGYRKKVNVPYIGFCEWTIKYPCLKWCNGSIYLPCGIKWCGFFPCGYKWCRINIGYPCFKLCSAKIPYLCTKYREAEQWCYDFTVIKERCLVVQSSLSGCCDGREYKWEAGCIGYENSVHAGKRMCFDAPLEDQGSCTISDQNIFPHQTDDSLSTGDVNSIGGGQIMSVINAKLGTCQPCIRKSSWGFAFFLILSILSIFIFSATYWISIILYVPTILFGLLRLAHYIGGKVLKRK